MKKLRDIINSFDEEKRLRSTVWRFLLIPVVVYVSTHFVNTDMDDSAYDEIIISIIKETKISTVVIAWLISLSIVGMLIYVLTFKEVPSV